jgi:hypothetical protein
VVAWAGMPVPRSGLMELQQDAALLTRLDDRSLNNNTFRASYVLIGYALPEEAQSPAVHRT